MQPPCKAAVKAGEQGPLGLDELVESNRPEILLENLSHLAQLATTFLDMADCLDIFKWLFQELSQTLQPTQLSNPLGMEK